MLDLRAEGLVPAVAVGVAHRDGFVPGNVGWFHPKIPELNVQFPLRPERRQPLVFQSFPRCPRLPGPHEEQV